MYLFLSSGDGFLGLSNFIKTVEEFKKPEDEEDLIMSFRVFDPENKGYIEANEMRKALLRLKGIPKQEIDDVLEAANLQENRHIYFDGKFNNTPEIEDF